MSGNELFAPVHGQKEDHARADIAGGDGGAQADGAAGIGERDDVAVFDVALGGIVGVNLAEGGVDVGTEAVDAAGFGHGVPLVADAAGGEDEGEFIGGLFGAVFERPMRGRNWSARRVGCGEEVVGVEAGGLVPIGNW